MAYLMNGSSREALGVSDVSERVQITGVRHFCVEQVQIDTVLAGNHQVIKQPPSLCRQLLFLHASFSLPPVPWKEVLSLAQ